MTLILVENGVSLASILSVPLYSVRFDRSQAETSILSREHTVPLATSRSSRVAIAKFATFVSMPRAGELLVDADLYDHLIVHDVATGRHQDQAKEDVDNTGGYICLIQPGCPCAHCENRHEAEVERLNKCP